MSKPECVDDKNFMLIGGKCYQISNSMQKLGFTSRTDIPQIVVSDKYDQFLSKVGKNLYNLIQILNRDIERFGVDPTDPRVARMKEIRKQIQWMLEQTNIMYKRSKMLPENQVRIGVVNLIKEVLAGRNPMQGDPNFVYPNAFFQWIFPGGQQLSPIPDRTKHDYQTFMQLLNRYFIKEGLLSEKSHKRQKCGIKELAIYQRTIQKYLTPHSPNKGVLANLATGMGKTCLGLATIKAFADAGWAIMWITKSNLKMEIAKDVWCVSPGYAKYPPDQVVIPSKAAGARKTDVDFNTELMPELGKIIISSYGFASRALAEGYAEKSRVKEVQFLQGQKKKYEDFLRNVLVIIDEAHLFYSKDIPANENPPTAEQIKKVENAIFTSYKKSGVNSCKVLLLTATPIPRDPLDGLKLLNLLIEKEEDRFNPVKFKQNHVDHATGSISQGGIEEFVGRAKGLIMFADTDYDPGTTAKIENNIIKPIEMPLTLFQETQFQEECIDKASKKSQLEQAMCWRQVADFISDEKVAQYIDPKLVEKKPSRSGGFERIQTPSFLSFKNWTNLKQLKRLRSLILGRPLQPQEEHMEFWKTRNLALSTVNIDYSMSPKLLNLLYLIQTLDQQHANPVKHVIYTNVAGLIGDDPSSKKKPPEWGPELIGSGLAAMGYEWVDMKEERNQLVPILPQQKMGFRNPNHGFAILSAKSHFLGEEVRPVGRKAEALRKIFNEPTNSHGEKIRLLIIDFSFKQGIDLKDVRYFHFFDAPLTKTDQVQAIGRVIRRCGHQAFSSDPQDWKVGIFVHYMVRILQTQMVGEGGTDRFLPFQVVNQLAATPNQNELIRSQLEALFQFVAFDRCLYKHIPQHYTWEGQQGNPVFDCNMLMPQGPVSTKQKSISWKDIQKSISSRMQLNDPYWVELQRHPSKRKIEQKVKGVPRRPGLKERVKREVAEEKQELRRKKAQKHSARQRAFQKARQRP